MKKYVYSFGNGTADGDGKMKDVLGGKGAGPRRDVPRPACRCLPDSRSRRKSATSSSRTATRCPHEIDEQMVKALAKLEKQIGKKLGDPAEPAAAQRALRREVLHARHDEHHPQPRPERRDHRGPGSQERQSALRLRLLPPLHPDVRRSGARTSTWRSSTTVFDERKHKAKAKLDTDLTADDLKAIIADYKKLVKKETKKPFPQDAREQLDARAQRRVPLLVESQGQLLPQDGKDPGRHRHRRQRAGHGVRQHGRHCCTGVGFTRDPGTGEKVFYGEFLVNAQGEDVVAGIRTPQPISELKDWNAATSTTQLREITTQPRKALQGHAGFRVHRARKARCTCCRPATASAPVRRRFASRSRWSKKA